MFYNISFIFVNILEYKLYVIIILLNNIHVKNLKDTNYENNELFSSRMTPTMKIYCTKK